MKISLWFLAFCFFGCSNSAICADFRLIGTNVYDFTFAGSPSNPSTYILRGTITHIFPQSVELSVPDGIMYVADIATMRDNFDLAGPGEQLKTLASFQLSQKPVTPAIYYSLDPMMRANFEPITMYKKIFVLHFSDQVMAAGLVVGQKVSTLALPTTTPGFWDHGIKIENIDCTQFFRIFPDHLALITNGTPPTPDKN